MKKAVLILIILLISHPLIADLKNQLFEAARSNNSELVKQLVEKGVDIKAKDYYGRTALMFAAGYGNFDIVKFIIEQGADINAKTVGGETALTIALR